MIFLQFLAAAHTSTVNCNEMDGDRSGQPANRIGKVRWRGPTYVCKQAGWWIGDAGKLELCYT